MPAHPYIGLTGTFPANDSDYTTFRGLVVDVTDGLVTLLGADGTHKHKVMAELVLDHAFDAFNRVPRAATQANPIYTVRCVEPDKRDSDLLIDLRRVDAVRDYDGANGTTPYISLHVGGSWIIISNMHADGRAKLRAAWEAEVRRMEGAQ